MRNFSKSMGLLWGFTITLHQQSTQLDTSSFISGTPSEIGTVIFFAVVTNRCVLNVWARLPATPFCLTEISRVSWYILENFDLHGPEQPFNLMTDEKTEAQRSKGFCFKAHSWLGAEPRCLLAQGSFFGLHLFLLNLAGQAV